jgi:hypothetical protein
MSRKKRDKYPEEEPTEKDEVVVQPTNDTIPQRIMPGMTQIYRSDGSAIYQEDPPGL